MSPLRQALGLIVLILVCFGVAAIGASVTTPSIDGWYAGLEKPPWTPPAWLFGPVWGVLYLSMAVAAWLVWRRVGLIGGAVPLALFALQLALNLGWSIVFFGQQNIGLGVVVIVALWFAITATILAFHSVTAVAGWLLVPYLIWVTFATALNLSIWMLNR